jgi:two-component system, NtrC family, sensor histidine kinase KinB
MKLLQLFGSGLRARFIAVAGILITTTVVSGLYSMASFSRLESFVGDALRDCETATSTISDLTVALEHEDDAVLLHLTDPRLGQVVLANSRQAVDASLTGLSALLDTPEEQASVRVLTQEIEAYRDSTDLLIASAAEPGGLERHHRDSNPLLRQAVTRASQIRDQHFVEMQQVARWARDEARQSVMIVSGVSIVALLLSIGVVFHLARVVVWPLRALGASAEAIRRGDFEHRTAVRSDDELGKLGECMNRMAEEVAESRRINLREVLRAKRTLEATMAALPDAVIVADTSGAISSANQAAHRLLGDHPSNGLNGTHKVDDIRLPAKTVETLKRALHGQLPAGHELHPHSTMSLRVGDELRHLVPRFVPVRIGSDEASGVVLVLNDVTEFVRFSERRVELVAVASHELRTPLTTLRMTLLMLQESATELGRREQELVRAALFGVEQLVGIVDEFLDLARIEAGQLRLSYGRVDIAELTSEVGRSFAHRCEEVGIALRVEQSSAPIQLWGDATRLRAVLANLLDNAVKYTPRGGTIRVRAGIHETKERTTPAKVEVSVTDTGPGVRPEYRDRIFEKFFRIEQLQPDADRGVRGSGIGLYLARQIVEAHAGTIACTAGENERGTHIGFVLPVEPPRLGGET